MTPLKQFGVVTGVWFFVLSSSWADDPCVNQELGGQRATYCEAAKDAKKSSSTAAIGMGLWGAVTGVCTYACAMSTNPSYAINAWWCMGSSIGASVADIGMSMALSKDMQSSMGGLMGLGMSGVMLMMQHKDMVARNAVLAKNKDALKAGKPTQKQDRDTGACISAAMAALQTGMKAMTLSQANKTRDQNLAMAAQVYDPSPQVPSVTGGSQGNGAARNSSRAQAYGSGASAPSSVADAKGNSSAATSGDPNLDKIMRDPDFQKTFKEVSGKSLEDYLNSLGSGSSASDAIGSAMGGLPNAGEIKTKAAEVEKEMRERVAKMDMNASGHAVAQGGGGGGGESGNENEALAGLMAQMMAGLMPGQDGKKDDSGAQEIEYLLKRKGADGLVEDRTISLFKRVGYRYRQSSTKLEQVPWAAQSNRAIASTKIPN